MATAVPAVVAEDGQDNSIEYIYAEEDEAGIKANGASSKHKYEWTQLSNKNKKTLKILLIKLKLKIQYARWIVQYNLCSHFDRICSLLTICLLLYLKGAQLGGGLYESIAGSLLNLAGMRGNSVDDGEDLYSTCHKNNNNKDKCGDGGMDRDSPADLGRQVLAYTLAKLGQAQVDQEGLLHR